MSFYKEVPGLEKTLESTLKFDTEPKAGSTNPVTSDGVKDAIDGAVGDVAENLQQQIDDIAEKAGSGYIPKGEATVATLNGLSGQENGELYTLTDAGTLTNGSLAVVAGDTVAWDATNGVWYKAMDYAPRQYGTNEIKNLPTTITAFRTGDYIAVGGDTPAKMGKDDLLKETAENALVDNVVPLLNLNDPTLWIQGGIDSSTGVPDYTTTSRISTKLLLLSNISDVKLDTAGNVTTRTIYAYNASKTYLGYAFGSIANVKATYPTAVYYRIGLVASSAITPSAIGNSVVLSNLAYLNKIVDLDNEIADLKSGVSALNATTYGTKNAVDLNDSTNWELGGANIDNGMVFTTPIKRFHTNLLKLSDSSEWSFVDKDDVGNFGMLCYDAYGNYLGWKFGAYSVASCKTSFPKAVWFRLYCISDSDKSLTDIGTNVVFGTSDMSSQNDDGLVQRVKILESSSGGWLVGKKWVACGDSFTHGDGVGVLPDGIYAGSRATYPFYIGNRTGMDIVDFAVNGSTLGTYSGSTTSNSFTISGGRLYQIPADADYITLYFGINDGHNAIPVGNESDSTTATFWGALNVALGYLTLNYPNARIGVIASNGCDADGYPQAAVDAAKKWGVPYLDLDGAVGCRTMIRCRRSPASAFVKNQILQQQRVSADNTHPNSYAHELESTFIETWLKSL